MSRSSLPFSMPMPHIQLKSTAFRSLAFACGCVGFSRSPPRRGACARGCQRPADREGDRERDRIQVFLRRKSIVVLPLFGIPRLPGI